ncbi:MAG: type II secretion system protein GspK [Gemmatimonadota bacterium]|nr:type II secretion system protein GspK [Gemmatimonadota bacterium]
MRRVRRQRPRRGVALLLVLWLTVLLAVVTMAASAGARSSGDLVAAKRAAATAQSMAESGIAVAVSAINDSLRKLSNDSVATNAYLNTLDVATNNGFTSLGNSATDTLSDGAFAIAIVDVDARLDVNEAGEAGFARFLREFTAPADAQLLAERVARRVKGEGAADSAEAQRATRDSISRVLLGRTTTAPRLRHPFESLDELLQVSGFNEALLARVAPLLTVDGDARINRRSAPRAVLEAAAGSIVDAPARLLVISRGWQLGHPLTHEIQAVYDVSAGALTLVRWRERIL